MSNQAASHINRATNSSPKKKQSKTYVPFSHADAKTVEQWVTFMKTAGYKLSKAPHTNLVDANLISAEVYKIN